MSGGEDMEMRERGQKRSFRRVPASLGLPTPVVTLLTDFGTVDYFVGAMKGVILSINANARIVDITHDIPPQDIHAGAFTLLHAYQAFPKGTIHVAVVDPGVGSRRRPILVVGGDQFFIGPDNGLFSYIYEREGEVRVVHLTRDQFFRSPVSLTFQARDLFAPVAGALSMGTPVEEFGEEIVDYSKLPHLKPKLSAGRTVKGAIIHIDRFGNCITNLTPDDITAEMIEEGVSLIVNGRKISSFRRFFAEETDLPTEVFAIWGSAGFLEIASYLASAAQRLGAERGQIITVISGT